MSFEGRYQKLCTPCNHYEEHDAYMEDDKCSQCGKPWTKSNLVDDTNGLAEGYDESMIPDYISNNSIFDKISEAQYKRMCDSQGWDSGHEELFNDENWSDNSYDEDKDTELLNLASKAKIAQRLMEVLVARQNLLDFIDSTEYPNPEFEKTFKKRIKEILA